MTDCQQNRLGDNLPTDSQVKISNSLLFQSYRKTYPADPVTEEDFGKLIEELHLIGSESEHSATPKSKGAHANPRSTPPTQLAAEQALSTVPNDVDETMNERDGIVDTSPNGVFAEFVNGWRNLRPSLALSNDMARGRPQQRKLNVLSWGFGD